MAEIRQPSQSFWVLFVLAGLVTLSMFYRVSTAVIAQDLVRDFGLDAETLGLLGGAFFYSFALFQIPIGPMLDRIGPRVVIGSFSLLGGVGSLLFAFGQSFTVALLGRILNGVGMACVMMGAFKVFLVRFPPERFATLAGTLLAVGTLGAILAASPLAYVASVAGWRTGFIVTGGIAIILAISAFWILKTEGDEGQHAFSSPAPEEALGVFQSIRLIVRNLAFWQLGALSFFRYGSFVGIQGLWLGPYLMEIKGYSPLQTGNVLLLMSLGMIAGSPISGRLSDRTSRSGKGVALGGSALYSLSLFPLVGLIPVEGPFWYGVIFFSLGFFNGFGIAVYSHAKNLFPVAISATAMALVNFFSIAGVAVFMPAMGRVIESFPRVGNAYPAEAYHLSFLICFIGMSASVVFYGFSKER
jgi:predicted MFS family arabinose efflux permease